MVKIVHSWALRCEGSAGGALAEVEGWFYISEGYYWLTLFLTFPCFFFSPLSFFMSLTFSTCLRLCFSLFVSHSLLPLLSALLSLFFLCRVFIDRCRPDYDIFQEITHLTTEQEQDLAEQQARLKEMREKIARQKQQDTQNMQKANLESQTQVFAQQLALAKKALAAQPPPRSAEEVERFRLQKEKVANAERQLEQLQRQHLRQQQQRLEMQRKLQQQQHPRPYTDGAATTSDAIDVSPPNAARRAIQDRPASPNPPPSNPYAKNYEKHSANRTQFVACDVTPI